LNPQYIGDKIQSHLAQLFPYICQTRFPSLLLVFSAFCRQAFDMSTHFRPEDSQLIHDLHQISKKSPKLIRSTVYSAPSDPSISIRSWKMNEFKYYDVPSPFPTLARGLFSRELPSGDDPDGGPKYQIVARGYDKFFNIGEVPWTDVSHLHPLLLSL